LYPAPGRFSDLRSGFEQLAGIEGDADRSRYRARGMRPPPPLLAALLAVMALAAGCGEGDGNPIEAQLKEETAARSVLGFPALATKNTTRVGGEDEIADAAAVAHAVYPAEGTPRPDLLTLVDAGDWQAGIAAAALMAPPLRAPVLLTDGPDIPDATAEAVKTLGPTGSKEAGGAQVLRIGRAGAPDGVRATSTSAGSPAEEAAAIDAFNTKAAGQPSENVMIVSAADPQYAMPAAAWAAKSGDAVLYVDRDTVPPATQKAIREHQQPGIYVLGPEQVISKKVERALQKYGGVKRIKAQTPVEFAIAFARYTDGSFGWGVTDPGHGVVFANAGRTQDATAGAPLSGTGKYGPLLLLESPVGIPPPVDEYLLDIQPGYRFDPVRGVYNHAWLMGDESAISLATQAKIDSLLEIVPVRRQGKSS
jgi:ell wall binding domain 2 (CWB2)